jgi:hypothetical protein
MNEFYPGSTPEDGECPRNSPVERLKRLRKRENLTESLDLLESCGIRSEEAQVFLLNEVGAIGGES